jgi:hypothetical protein
MSTSTSWRLWVLAPRTSNAPLTAEHLADYVGD